MSLEVVALVLAAIALPVPFVIEWIKRPRLEAKLEGHWVGKTPTPWTFAHVWIRNKPLLGFLRPLFVREAATGCTVTVEFRRGGERAIPPVAARWSSRPEPMRVEAVDDQGMAVLAEKAGWGAVPESRVVYDPTLVPPTLSNDLAPGRWEEVAVAILFQDGQAYAWGAESYADGGRRQEWKLERGEYEVTLRVESSGIQRNFRFKLDNLSVDFSAFQLRA